DHRIIGAVERRKSIVRRPRVKLGLHSTPGECAWSRVYRPSTPNAWSEAEVAATVETSALAAAASSMAMSAKGVKASTNERDRAARLLKVFMQSSNILGWL